MLGVGHSDHWARGGGSSRYTGLIVTVGLHIVAVVLLLNYEPVRSALNETVPIMVSLIEPVAEKPKERPKPPQIKPKIQRSLPPQPESLLVAVTEAPAPVTQAQPPTPPQPAPMEVVAPAPAIVQAPAPVPVIPPNYNADYLDNPAPAYPAQSRRLGEQGRVTLRVLVNINGSADKIELRTSSGSPRLDEAALDTVKRWRFVPARQGTQPVAAWVLIPISFALKG